MNILILDCGGSSIKFSTISRDGCRTNAGTVPAPLTSKERFAETVAQIYRRFHGCVDGVGISMPGFVNGATGYLRTAGGYHALYDTNLYELLKKDIPVPFVVENDGKCAAMAEVWHGALADVKEGAVLIIGSFLAGGIIHNGKLLRGHSGTAGEMSFIQLPSNLDMSRSVMTQCGMAGLTLRTASALGIDLMKCPYRDFVDFFQLSNTNRTELNDDPRFENGIDGQMFFDLLEEGNEVVGEIYKQFIEDLATLLMTIQALTDPEYIVLGGAVTAQKRIFRDLRHQLENYNSFMSGNATPVIQLLEGSTSEYPNEFGCAYHYFKTTGAF